ncbi:MAG: response regulator transcription factor [Betaproteobacteria bacterium]|nr:response regulator transcription factor [Betaproteobacteria bacterium]
MIKCVIAEDEDLLRAELASVLKSVWPGIDIVAEAADGGAALEDIAAHQPAVAFLDIRMPGLTGIDVAKAARETSPDTEIVFVTAYDKHAIDAFEHGAVDYLMKPVTRERLAATVERIRKRLEAGTPPRAPDEAALQDAVAGHARAPLTWITASAGRETRLILIEDVVYFQSDNKYTVVMTAEGEALIRKPIRELLAELDPAQFKQVHRSTIVNFRAIQSVTRDEFGKGLLKLKRRPETLTVSQPYMVLFRNM